LAFGVVALLVACLSILDMFLPKPYDGVVLDPDRADLYVRAVVPGSGAANAGLRPGDRIVGVGSTIVRTPAEAGRALQTQRIGQSVSYLIERGARLTEHEVLLGPRQLGTPLYMYACVLGFLFFFTGLFVLLSRPTSAAGSPSPVFFVLCTLFLLFLVCRLRPASYSWVDSVVLTTGTLSLLALPAAFLHFFLVFPRRLRVTLVPPGEAANGRGLLSAVERFLNSSQRLFTTIYLLPPLLYALTLAAASLLDVRVRLVSGAPLANWVLMGDYLVLGLLALLGSLLQAQGGGGAAADRHRLCRHRARRAAVPGARRCLPFAAAHRPVPVPRRHTADPGAAHLRLRDRPVPVLRYPGDRPPVAAVHTHVAGRRRHVRGCHCRLQPAVLRHRAWRLALLPVAARPRHPAAVRPAPKAPAGAGRSILLPRGVRRPASGRRDE
jgi:hypothetical protein